jgi:hypothetical protein
MIQRTRQPKVEYVTEELDLHNGGYIQHEVAGSSEGSWLPVRKRFSFTLCRKATVFGEVPIDQFWLPQPLVYAQRKNAHSNHDAIVECYWTLCMRERTIFEDDVVDSYILAKLLPYARSHGSRRVFEDAILSRATRLGQGKYNLIQSLENQLAACRSQEIDLEGFRDKTAKLLGPPDYPKDTWEHYQQMQEELLGEGRRALERLGPAGLQTSLERWQRWMLNIGRHRGNQIEKQVLDIFSYECRAALHRCYSATWFELLPQLAEKYSFSPESMKFHSLWHLVQCMPSSDPRTLFYLFHGHVFGLHPGTGIFIQTRTGSELIGEVLQAEEGRPAAFRRLLNGLLIAMIDYADRGQTIDESRRWEAVIADKVDVESAYNSQLSQTNRRLKRKRLDD